MKSHSSSADWNRAARPDTVCSTLPASGTGPVRNYTTNARCGDSGEIASVVAPGVAGVSFPELTMCPFLVMI
jgi:hypothetical protein